MELIENKGWIKLHRSLLDWEWWDDHNTTRLFIFLILKANHKIKRWRGMVIKEGQIVTGRSALASAIGLTQQQVKTSLYKLKSTGEIVIETTNKFSIITIKKWSKYQQENNQQTTQQITSKNVGDCSIATINKLKQNKKITSKQPNKQPTNNQQITNKQPTNNQQITTNKNDKNEKNEKNEKNNILLDDFLKFVFDNTGKNYKPNALETNFNYWIAIYSLDEMKKSYLLATVDTFWKDKITPMIFFRRKNPNGEPVDRIGEFLEKAKPTKTKNQIFFEKIQAKKEKTQIKSFSDTYANAITKGVNPTEL